MPLTLRPYQEEALDALSRHFAEKTDNPCVVLPTGSGKSYVIAELIRRMIEAKPEFRCVVLAHRQELIWQNAEEFKNLGMHSDVGIYCLGLGRRETREQVTFAMIQSVFRHADDFPPIDMVIVDEAHHIPVTDNGMYREFLRGIKKKSPGARVAGFTATPYRLDVGHVCHKDYVLNTICYEANVGALIGAGYLCNLRSKVSKLAPNLAGISEVNGDYKTDELSARVCVEDLVKKTVDDAIARLNAEQRKCCVWFCVNVKHCGMVKDALAARGETVGMVTGETDKCERATVIESFRKGELRHLLNVQVFTEGFNVKQVDAIMLLRPTLSRGLYVQMVGRGLRLHPDKKDCIILDYARCIEEHGPIDLVPDQYVPMEICGACNELFPRALRKCPNCGHVVSEEEVRKHDAHDEKKRQLRRLHGEIASCREILAQEYGCAGYRRVVNDKGSVETLLMRYAYKTAHGGREFQVKHGRIMPTRCGGGEARAESKTFLKEFIEYARYEKLTNLPDMLRNYFEYEGIHKSEKRRERLERRKEIGRLLGI